MYIFEKRVLIILDHKHVFGFQNAYVDVVGNMWTLGVNIENKGNYATFGYIWVMSDINDIC